MGRINPPDRMVPLWIWLLMGCMIGFILSGCTFERVGGGPSDLMKKIQQYQDPYMMPLPVPAPPDEVNP